MQNQLPVNITATALTTPLAIGVDENMQALLLGASGIQQLHDEQFSNFRLPLAAFDQNQIAAWQDRFNTYSRFDSLLLACAAQLKDKCTIDLSSPEVAIIMSTTKGNIELLDDVRHTEKCLLTYSANLLKDYFQNPNEPFIISNACISGLSSILWAKRLLQSNQFKHVVVIGCDVLTRFVISGFNSFHALSKEPCRPFDSQRNGINLGEAAAACILSAGDNVEGVEILSGLVSNDANHISGPSKTGEELAHCIQYALQSANIQPTEIGFISAHGTATVYNDEMESKAFEIAGLTNIPVFSLKAHYGHTLGAAGVLETIISSECLKKNIVLPSVNFESMGVSGNIQVNTHLLQKESRYAIKTGSGFGGCNAALLLGINM
ncbi:MAG: beta-ketoacyl synthase [Chitinophagaceae bacterium]|nr:beta-ketoacyl synthase [Chitinophagaceae bacterium]